VFLWSECVDMSIICMFSVSIHHCFESSFVSFITVLYHLSSFLHTLIRIALHTYCISELFSGDLELFASKLEETSHNQKIYSTTRRVHPAPYSTSWTSDFGAILPFYSTPCFTLLRRFCFCNL